MDILVVVDMQNDFISGSLETEEAKKIVGRVKDRVENFKGPIIFTQDTHNEDYLETREGKNLPVKHCIKGTWGWQIEDSLKEFASEIVEKPTFGSFDLIKKIKSLSKGQKIDSITLIGLCTDICVISNALLCKAEFYESLIIVDSSACAGVSVKSHENALESMKMCHIEVI